VARTDAQDPTGIHFGTSGWRGVLGEAVTYPRLRALVGATADWMRERSSSRRVLIGYDTRFASRAMAEIAAAGLAAAGFEACLSRGPVPTPVLTHALHRRRVAGGLMLTASHNPPEYHGIKVFGPDGAAIPDREASSIEARLVAATASTGSGGGRIRRLDLSSAYLRDLARLVAVDRRSSAPVRVFYDAMHGAGAGVLDAALDRAGFRVTRLRADIDPVFGGGVPDPIATNLSQLAARVAAGRGRRLGLATDGDADRVGVVLAEGRILSATEVLALLVDHLADTGRVRHGLAISFATGSLVERVANARGLRVLRRPIGFKHLADDMLAGQVDVAGEESGGFAWSRMGVDKDGMLAGVLLCELAAKRRGGLEQRLAELEQEFGRSDCSRRALALTPDRQRGLDAITATPPERIGRSEVRSIDREDGLRVELDDGFVMWRCSGTEPVLRVYAEARGPTRLAARLTEAERLLARAAEQRQH
jgi:phosphomannomutase